MNLATVRLVIVQTVEHVITLAQDVRLQAVRMVQARALMMDMNLGTVVTMMKAVRVEDTLRRQKILL